MADRHDDAPFPARDLLGVAPLFGVEDLHRAVEFYADKLGFDRPHLWGDPPGFAMPARDGLVLMLQLECDAEKRKSNFERFGGWDAYYWVKDCKALAAEFQAKGVKLQYGPEFREGYGNWEFGLVDPDGHLLAFGQETGDGKFYE